MRRKNKKVIILGSGESILDLTEKEIDYINDCEYVIAVNKFAAFYKKARIIPTHIYFHDLYGIHILFYILEILKGDNFDSITIFTNSYVKNLTYSNILTLVHKVIIDLFYYRFISLIKIVLKFGVNCDIHLFKLSRNLSFIRVPASFKIIQLRLTKWNSDKNSWGKSMRDKLYHYRGSLTTILNIASIIAPGCNIALVGNDFKGDRYFYEDELDKLGIPWKDLTYEKVKKHKLHFSFQKIDGKSMNDKIPYIIRKLKETNNYVSCNNKSSLLVTESGINYKKLLNDRHIDCNSNL